MRLKSHQVHPDGAQIQVPPEVRDLAFRLGVPRHTSVSAIHLRQTGTMRDRASAPFMRFRARQTIWVDRTEFLWLANTGPLGAVNVIDALEHARARLEVRLLNVLPLARSSGDGMAAKGEIMRYLAELAWAPDAIIRNSSLVWEVGGAGSFWVSAAVGESSGAVHLKLNEDGRIDTIFAPDRPRKEGGGFVERPWYGRFFDYRRHDLRWLPFQAEVGWTIGSTQFVVWRGRLTEWLIA